LGEAVSFSPGFESPHPDRRREPAIEAMAKVAKVERILMQTD